MRAAWMVLLAAGLLPAARADFQLFLVNGDTERAAPAVYNLGTVYPGDVVPVHFRLRNLAALPAVLSYLEVRGTGFGPKNPLALPVTLDAQAAVDFTVTFSAPEFGSYGAIVDSEGTSVTLLVTVPVAPPLPPARLTVILPPPHSAQQGSVMVNLDAAAPRAASGSVALDFQPAPAGASDPAIVFASGARTAAFACDAGATQCRFGDQQGAPFQTGTTAGVLMFTARLGTAPGADAWSAMQVLGHVTEMIPYWLNWCRVLIAATGEPPSFGRTAGCRPSDWPGWRTARRRNQTYCWPSSKARFVARPVPSERSRRPNAASAVDPRREERSPSRRSSSRSS